MVTPASKTKIVLKLNRQLTRLLLLLPVGIDYALAALLKIGSQLVALVFGYVEHTAGTTILRGTSIAGIYKGAIAFVAAGDQ